MKAKIMIIQRVAEGVKEHGLSYYAGENVK